MKSKVKVVSHLSDKGYPVHGKHYAYAHEQASGAERRANPKEYKKSIKDERKQGKHELMATHKKNGQIEIEKKYSKDKKMRKDLILHEKTERKVMNKMGKKK